MQVKLLTQLTTAEVRQIARSAANSDESLDTANVFPIGTDRHAVFTTEYLSQLSALEEGARELQRSFPLDCFPNGQDRTPDVLARKGTGIHDP